MAKKTSSTFIDSISNIGSVEETLLMHTSIQNRISNKKERATIEDLLKMHDAIQRFEVDSLSISYEFDLALEYFYAGSLSKALLYTTKSISSFNPSNPNYDVLAQAHNLDGILNMELGNFSKAIDGFTASMETYLLYAPSRVTYPIGNLSNVYYLIGDIKNAIKYTKEAAKHSKQMEGKEFYYNYGYDCIKLGAWYDELNELDSASYYHQKSLSLVAKLDTGNITYKNLVSMVNEETFKYHLKRNNIKTAKKYLNKILNNSFDLTSSKTGLLKAQFNLAIGDQKKLFAFLDQPLNTKASLEEKIELLKFKIDNYKKEDQYEKALLAYELLQELKTNDAKINQEQYAEYAYAQFETFEKEKEIQRLTKLSQITRLKSQKQQAVYFAVSALVIGLLSVMFFFYYFRFRRKDRFSKQLKKEVEKKTHALSQLNNVLTSKNEELEQFNFILSHNLREPIRSIVSFSNLIYSKTGQQEQIQEFSNFITIAGNQLNFLLDGIAEFQSSTQLTIKKEQINLVEIISEFISINHQLIEKNNVLIIEDGLQEIYSSKVGVSVILKNLIENGIKFNDSVQPTIRISVEEKEKEYSIIIKDNGIGIQEVYFDKIFTMFKRLHNRKAYQGSGLGLAICHKMALKLNGKIEVVESTIGVGTTIQLTIQKDQDSKNTSNPTTIEALDLAPTSV